MSQLLPDLSHRWPCPLETAPQAVLQPLTADLPADACLLALFDPQAPRLDEILLLHNWPVHEIAAWCQVGFEHDRLLRILQRAGIVSAQPGQTDLDSIFTRHGHCLALALPEPFHHRLWLFILLRHNTPWSTHHQQLATLILRHWIFRFALPAAPAVPSFTPFRLLLGHDARLLLGDLTSQMLLLHQPTIFDELRQAFRPIVEQRYTDLVDFQSRDLILRLADHPVWIRFIRRRALDLPEAEQWYLELEPLEPTDAPPLGLVADPRIARALATIHTRFAQRPNLAQLAQAAHLSPFHFHRLFTQHLGLSPKEYLQRYQIQLAKSLLRRTNLPIATIARTAGFASHGHFTSTFHRLTRLSPSAYREKFASPPSAS